MMVHAMNCDNESVIEDVTRLVAPGALQVAKTLGTENTAHLFTKLNGTNAHTLQEISQEMHSSILKHNTLVYYAVSWQKATTVRAKIAHPIPLARTLIGYKPKPQMIWSHID